MPTYICPECELPFDHNPPLGPRESAACTATLNCTGRAMSRPARGKKRKAEEPTDDEFEAMLAAQDVPKVKKPWVVMAGRANSAPPITRWPVNGADPNVVAYVADIATDPAWGANAAHIYLPFNLLHVPVIGDADMTTRWGGLVIKNRAANRDARLAAHFAAITAAMTAATSSAKVTEAVGEAAAAMAVLDDAQFNNYELVWGFDTHSGTGIDQIWSDNGAHHRNYLIVEAKGPNAALADNAFTPQGYNQMERQWIIDRLQSMLGSTNPQAPPLARRMFDDLAIEPVVDAMNPRDSGRNRFMSQPIVGAPRATLHLRTYTAEWGAQGMLHYDAETHAYTYR